MANFKFKCSQCHVELEAPEDLAGEQAECTGCGAPIKIPFPRTSAPRIVVKKRAVVKKRPSDYGAASRRAKSNATTKRTPSRTSAPPPAPKDGGPVAAGWVCLLIGCVVMLMPVLGTYLGAPLVLVAFIMSIVVLAKNNVGAGIALLLCSFVLPAIAFLLSLGVLLATA